MGKIVKVGLVAFGVYAFIYFLPDARRYIKMSTM
jgi:hypothetical protein